MSIRFKAETGTETNPNAKPGNDVEKRRRTTTDLGNGSEIIYIPRFLLLDESWKFFDYLNNDIPWTRPTLRVFGRSCLQPRDTCYVASVGLPDLSYSGYQPHAYSWDDYPPLKDILDATAKTKVINSCLNPVWNEELSFSLKEPVGVLNLEVFDKDHFKADDKMGKAYLSLQPLVSAYRMRQILQVSSGEITLRKVVPDIDNCLFRDSSISCINGEVVQDVWLRLDDVESGEIELKIKLLDPPAALPLK